VAYQAAARIEEHEDSKKPFQKNDLGEQKRVRKVRSKKLLLKMPGKMLASLPKQSRLQSGLPRTISLMITSFESRRLVGMTSGFRGIRSCWRPKSPTAVIYTLSSQ